MFETRLRILLVIFAAGAVIIVGRLFQLQAVHADYYRRQAEQSLLLKPQQLPFVRGRILDRTGEVLALDEPGWDIRIDYEVLAADMEEGILATDQENSVTRRVVKRYKRRYPSATTDAPIEHALRQEFNGMWADVAAYLPVEAAGDPIEELRGRAREIHERVGRIRRAVTARRGFDSPVREETIAHAVVSGLDADAQILARTALGDYPWAHVVPSSVRKCAGDAVPFAHVLGRLGRVDAETVAVDPNADDPFAGYLADEYVGITGVEYAAEAILRGRRGRITMDRHEEIIEDIHAEDGRDVVITVHAELQRRLYDLLGNTVRQIPESAGGAIVVLDVPSREVLALVSYPAYDPNRFDELYPELRDDTEWLPLRFRAVASQYAPGSTFKPLAALAGLTSGRITLDTRMECTGSLFPEHPDRWRCWQIHGSSRRKAHGTINVVEALIGSCNVFMYRLGESLGIDTLCDYFNMVGIGRLTGIGLREETRGVNPTPSWLATERDSPVYPAHGRLFAIGQGEILVTPVQLANLMATYASGRFRPVTLIRTGELKPEWSLPGAPEYWHAIRRGIYGVVNDPDGTAYKSAHFVHAGYALCGKTGSATTYPWPTAYWVPFVGGDGLEDVALVYAGAEHEAITKFTWAHPEATFDPNEVEVARRWPPNPPPPGERYSHAWFGGYLQALGPDGQPAWDREPRVAFAVLVEFGGSGGRTSGPLARQVAAELINLFGTELEFDLQAASAVPP